MSQNDIGPARGIVPSQSKKITIEPAQDMLDWSRPEHANSAACLSISARHLLLIVQPQ
jgi:hypothetical protein